LLLAVKRIQQPERKKELVRLQINYIKNEIPYRK